MLQPEAPISPALTPTTTAASPSTNTTTAILHHTVGGTMVSLPPAVQTSPLITVPSVHHPQPNPTSGYALSPKDLLQMNESERIAILKKVKAGEMSVDDALGAVLEEKKVWNGVAAAPTHDARTSPSPATIYAQLATTEKQFVDLLADVVRRYLQPLAAMEWVSAVDKKLLINPFRAVLIAHADFLRELARALSKGVGAAATSDGPMAALLLAHAPSIAAANIGYAAVVEKLQNWFEERAAVENSPLVEFMRQQNGSVAELQVTLDYPASRVQCAFSVEIITRGCQCFPRLLA
jgi:hypothetical protein